MSKVIIINGPIGSGKTTVGKGLAEKLGGVFLDLDDFMLAEIGSWDNLNRNNEAAMWCQASRQAAGRINQLGPEPEYVVIAGPFLHKEDLVEVKRDIQHSPALYFYSLDASPEIRYERTVEREKREPSNVWYEELERIKNGLQKPAGMVIANEASVEDAVDKIAAAVRENVGNL